MNGSKLFRDLTPDEINLIKLAYADESIKKGEAQQRLSKLLGVTCRTIRVWANNLNLSTFKKPENVRNSKIMVYDIETSRAEGKFWWTGKQYINHNQITKLPRIISIAWKYLGDEKVYALRWNEFQNDKEMLEKFMPEFNSCDMVIGQNSDRFDNRWIAARAALHGIEYNRFVKSFDIMKQTKRLFRLPSYSMAFIAEFFGLTLKKSHEGIIMWEMIEDGTKEQQLEYLDKMIDYNVGDIVTTEEIYYRLLKYMGQKIHFGVFNGCEKYTCPNCGGNNVSLYKTTYTTAGTIQHIMKCNDDDTLYKISNRDYMKFLEYKFNNLI